MIYSYFYFGCRFNFRCLVDWSFEIGLIDAVVVVAGAAVVVGKIHRLLSLVRSIFPSFSLSLSHSFALPKKIV